MILSPLLPLPSPSSSQNCDSMVNPFRSQQCKSDPRSRTHKRTQKSKRAEASGKKTCRTKSWYSCLLFDVTVKPDCTTARSFFLSCPFVHGAPHTHYCSFHPLAVALYRAHQTGPNKYHTVLLSFVQYLRSRTLFQTWKLVRLRASETVPQFSFSFVPSLTFLCNKH